MGFRRSNSGGTRRGHHPFANVEGLECRRLLSIAVKGVETLVNPTGWTERDSDLAVAGNGQFIVAKLSSQPVDLTHINVAVTATRFSRGGAQIGDPIVLVSIENISSSFQGSVSASMDSLGDAVVAYRTDAWTNQTTLTQSLTVARISKDGQVNNAFGIAEADLSSNLGLDAAVSMDVSGGFFVGWTTSETPVMGSNPSLERSRVYVRSFDAGGNAKAAEFIAAEETGPYKPSAEPPIYNAEYSAVDIAAYRTGDGAVVAFNRNAGPSRQTVRYAMVSTSAVTAAPRDIDGNRKQAGPSVVVFARNDFAIGYLDSGTFQFDPRDADAFVQRFDVTGNIARPRVTIEQPMGYATVKRIDVAAMPDDGFVAAWHETNYDIPSNEPRNTIHVARYTDGDDPDAPGPIQVGPAMSMDDSAVDPVAIGASIYGDPVVAYRSLPMQVRAYRLSSGPLSFAELREGVLYVVGTAGDDTIAINRDQNEIVVTRNSGRDVPLRFAAADVNVIDVSAAGGNDVITNGTSLRSTLRGGDGNDTIFGGANDDRIIGDTGDDSLWGNDGVDRLYGLDGRDSMFGNGGSDRLEGGAQPDFMRGNGGRDKIYGGGGNDRLYGSDGGDWIWGGNGDNQIFGEGGNDHLYGDANGVDIMRGGAGDDWFVAVDQTADQLFGDGGRDSANADAIDVLTSIEFKTFGV